MANAFVGRVSPGSGRVSPGTGNTLYRERGVIPFVVSYYLWQMCLLVGFLRERETHFTGKEDILLPFGVDSW
jgi:hypothetical protein